MSTPLQTTLVSQLQARTFDVLVVGGGITGAWIVLQCTALGLSTALVERGDFGGETSSASSKLLHGGIRYLQQMQLSKVRESAMERCEYLYAAPHLAHAVPFIVPTYKDVRRSKFLLAGGLIAYHLLGAGQRRRMGAACSALPLPQHLNREQLNRLCDLSHHAHTGALAFPEVHMHDSERTVWSIVDSARARGAIVANYTEAKGLLMENGRVCGVTAANSCQGQRNLNDQRFEIRASLVVNAAGPWVDRVNTTISSDFVGERLPPIISNYASGAHVITRQLLSKHAIAITTGHQSTTKIDRGGRHIFIIPWRGHSLIGTSYRETTDPDGATALHVDDLGQLLSTVNEALPNANLCADDVISAYCGLYPLRVETVKNSVYQGSGEYVIVDHQDSEQLEGLVTALGAKFTTGRVLAEKTVSLIVRKLAATRLSECPDYHLPPLPLNSRAFRRAVRVKLLSAGYDRLSTFESTQQSKLASRFNRQQITHLVRAYGSELDRFIEFLDTQNNTDELYSLIVDSQPDILGQVLWAMEYEMACQLDDVLLRRTSVALLGISESEVRRVALFMARHLSWNNDEITAQLKNSLNRQRLLQQATRQFFT